MSKPELEGRVHALEVGHEVQAEILVQIQGELLEADALALQVGRLADGSGDLAAAMLKLDKTARATARLDAKVKQVEANAASYAELKQVKDSAATTQEVEARVEKVKDEAVEKAKELAQEQHKERRNLAWRIAAALTTAVVVFGGLLAFTINSDYHACLERQKRVDIQVAFYTAVRDSTPAKTERQGFIDQVNEAIDGLEGTRVNCGELYPIHWGAKP